MKVKVNDQLKQFHLCLTKSVGWVPAAGHEIQIGDFTFCAVQVTMNGDPYTNITEVTSGVAALNLKMNRLDLMQTATKEGTMEYYQGIGERLAKHIEKTPDLAKQIREMRQLNVDMFGERPPIIDLMDPPANELLN